MSDLCDHFALFERDYFEGGIGYDGYKAEDADYRAEKLVSTMGLIPGDRVLDVGCAYGMVVKALRDLGIDAVGIDVSQWGARNERSGYYVRASGHALPFKDRAFDCVYSQGTLEHIPEEIIDRTLEEIRRVGKGGYLAITFGDIEIYPVVTTGLCLQIEKEGRTTCGEPAVYRVDLQDGVGSELCEKHKDDLEGFSHGAEKDPTHTCMHSFHWWIRKPLPPTFLLVKQPPHQVEDVYGPSNAYPFQGRSTR